MAWSISPSTASIDDSGNAWFPEAVGNSKTYRITYTDGDGCSSSTTYTIPGCSPTDCTVYQFNNLNAEEGAKDNSGTAVAMSIKSKSPLTFSRSDSDSWITYLSTSDDGGRYIYICKAENNSGGYREGRAVFVSDDGCEFVATVRQKASGGEPTKDISTYVNKGSVTTSSSQAEYITFTAGGSTYPILAQLGFDVAAEAIPYPTAMFGKTITAVSVKTEVGETFSATVNPTTITNSTNQVTVTLQGGSGPTTCTVTFNIGGSYNYIDMVALMNPSSGGSVYQLNGTGSSRTAEIACGITFTGIVFNDTVQQHCAYLTNSTGGTISNGATFSATITGSTCS